MRYFADYIKGKPYQKTVLWENSSPTSNFASQTVTLSDNISNYDQIAIISKSELGNNDLITTIYDAIVGRIGSNNRYIGGVSGNNGLARGFNFDSETEVSFASCAYVNSSGIYNNWCIPLKIIGIKKGLGEVNPPVAEKFTFSIGTTETVITLPHAPKSIVALYNTSSSYPKAGTCMYDVVNEIFLKSSGTGVWTKFEVDGDKLTLLGDNSTSNWTYDCIVV